MFSQISTVGFEYKGSIFSVLSSFSFNKALFSSLSKSLFILSINSL